jgi:hypothetical protein
MEFYFTEFLEKSNSNTWIRMSITFLKISYAGNKITNPIYNYILSRRKLSFLRVYVSLMCSNSTPNTSLEKIINWFPWRKCMNTTSLPKRNTKATCVYITEYAFLYVYYLCFMVYTSKWRYRRPKELFCFSFHMPTTQLLIDTAIGIGAYSGLHLTACLSKTS